MKYYKDINNKVFAFEDNGSQDSFVGVNLIPISNKDALNITNSVVNTETEISYILDEIRQFRIPILSVLDGMQVSNVLNGNLVDAKHIEMIKTNLKELPNIQLSESVKPAGVRHLLKIQLTNIKNNTYPKYKSAFNSLPESWK